VQNGERYLRLRMAHVAWCRHSRASEGNGHKEAQKAQEIEMNFVTFVPFYGRSFPVLDFVGALTHVGFGLDKTRAGRVKFPRL
jgi:hypothetical protein